MQLQTQTYNKIVNFTDLETWKEGHRIVLEIYMITKNFPKSELYGLTDQMRRCAVSITSNIAEGFFRFNIKEKLQFFRISGGSLTELQNQLIIAKDIGFLDEKTFEKLFEQSTVVLKMLNALIRNTKTRFQIPNSRF